MSTLAAPVAQPKAARSRRHSRLGVTGWVAAVIVVLATLVAVAGPWLTPHDPNLADLASAWIGPTLTTSSARMPRAGMSCPASWRGPGPRCSVRC